MQPAYTTARTQGSAIETNKVLRNTYGLLSMTLIFSAIMAVVSMNLNLPFFGWWTLIGYLGFLFLTNALRNSIWGIASVFAMTGFMGLTMGPILNFYVSALSNGAQLIAFALGGTGVIFLTMSGIALTTKRDFSWMGKFLTIGILVAFVAGIGAAVFQIPSLALAVSSMFILLMSGLILFETQQIIRGGETNYIMATVTLYVSIYNLFMSLLHLLMAFAGED